MALYDIHRHSLQGTGWNKAKRREITLQCKDIDEVTRKVDIHGAIKDQFGQFSQLRNPEKSMEVCKLQPPALH